MSIRENLQKLKSSIPEHVTLVAVTKTHSSEKLLEAYNSAHKQFGENRVQEMKEKFRILPVDIQWHMIGHLQTNKVKEIISFVSLIHSIDSLKLLNEVNKQAEKAGRVVDCLLQIYIAKEESKFGFDFNEVEELLGSGVFAALHHIRIKGLMGMASNTTDEIQVRKEFRSLRDFFYKIKSGHPPALNLNFEILSMGMSSDYQIAIEEGSTLIRVGSLIFGERNQPI